MKMHFSFAAKITFCMFLLLASGASAQLLEKRITLRLSNKPLDEALQQIGNAGNFSFSYSPDIIDVKSRVTVQAENQTVREILNALFKGKIRFKERRKYIILQKEDTPPAEEEPENFNLNGYVIDEATGKKLANASIYEAATLASTVSNQAGYFKIRLPATNKTMRLEVRKENYIGKSISIVKTENTYLPISLLPDTIKPLTGRLSHTIRQPADSLHHRIEIPQIQLASTRNPIFDSIPRKDSLNFAWLTDYDNWKKTYKKVESEFVSAFASAKQAVHTRNIEDTLHRSFQASILPFLGTNQELSGNIVNEYSINLIAGYSLGVSKLEIGSMVNVVRGNVTGFQLAGVSNVVGHNVTGFQYANFLNLTLGSIRGFQGTHIINYIGKDLTGFQVAGVGNVVAGVLNGYQFSLGYNYAHAVRSGHQIGFINYADSTAKIPFGFFSFVRTNGYRRYEFSVNELNYFNTAFKTGVSRFYNIFNCGFNGLAANKPLITLGYGVGTAQNLGRGWMVNADLTGNLILLKDKPLQESGLGLFRFNIDIEKRLGKHIAFFAGPSVNYLSGKARQNVETFDMHITKPSAVIKPKDNTASAYTWLGAHAGIRICNLVN